MKTTTVDHIADSVESTSSTTEASEATTAPNRYANTVTARAFLLGLVLTVLMAWANAWIETTASVHFLGGIQMPFGSVFVLFFFILAINWPLRALHRWTPASQLLKRLAPPFSTVELLTLYSMLLFAALVSTPGCDNQFMTVGPTLFYFSSRENNWASLFYEHVPRWFAPGWDGVRFRHDVIDKLYLGGVGWHDIPWHAWTVMLVAWTVFLVLVYALLFFVSLMLRKQWLEHEALAFPLVELPLQMVEVDGPGQTPPGKAFWTNPTMWCGFAVAAVFHFLTGMNAHFPSWPTVPVNMFNGVGISFTEQPWNALPGLTAHMHLGAIGLAFLLTREVSFSFWFFYLLLLFQYVVCEMLGFPISGFTKIGIMSRPSFMIYQATGAWIMMTLLIIWTAREQLMGLLREAISGRVGKAGQDEPFSARFVLVGFVLSLIGLLAWCQFSGINVFYAAVFMGIFLMTSLVIARLVVEGGFFFPQAPYYPLQWMTTGMFGYAAIGASNLTKLAFLQQTLLTDTRTNVLPAFLHTMKIAESLKLDRRGLRRLLACALVAMVIALGITYVATLQALYDRGGLTTDTWFTKDGPTVTINATATAIKTQPVFDPSSIPWIAIGAATLWLLVLCRSRFPWFPLHPLGILPALTYPLSELWFPFFAGWLIKSLTMKYGGSESHTRIRPFMIGLILGNLSATMIWLLIGMRSGVLVSYWPG